MILIFFLKKSNKIISKLKLYIVVITILVFTCSCSNNTSIPLDGSSSKVKIIQSPQDLSQTVDRIKKVAQKSTVVITLGGKIVGSGVIIGRDNNTLYILTVRHVIGIAPGEIEDPYKINTSGGEEFEVDYKTYDRVVSFLPNNTDLAVITVRSERSPNEDDVAKLTNSITQNMPIYVFSYLPCDPSSNNIAKYPTQISNGEVLKIRSRSIGIDPETNLQGYDTYYNNNTVAGMSGSPVFDINGRVIAIHAKTDNDRKMYNSEKCENLPLEPGNDLGQNWGISIKLLNDLKSGLPSSLLSKLEIDERPSLIKNNSKDNKTASPVQISPSPCPPFIAPGDTCTTER
jgi:hypothetical protein